MAPKQPMSDDLPTDPRDDAEHGDLRSRTDRRAVSDRSSVAGWRVRFAGLLTDLAYAFAAVVLSPVWLVRMIATGKIRTDWSARFGNGLRMPAKARPRVVFHAVSVGEVNALRGLVERLASDKMRPEIVISAMTDTGFARAQALFQAKHTVVRTPFDFTGAMRLWFDRLDPDLLVLVELELWPNMTRLASARDIPVVVINGRLSDRSFPRYMRVRRWVTGMFARATMVLAQNRVYADRFLELGAQEVLVSGNMKWDSVAIRDGVPGAEKLAEELGITRDGPLIVAGSTEPGEEVLLRDALPANARLLIAPRKPEWFDSVCANLPNCVRRSRGERGTNSTRYFVLDTIGELGMAYALADVVVMGRSFGKLYGSDPIEPASLGKAVIIGPRVADFRDVVDAFKRHGGIRQVDRDALPATLAELTSDTRARAEIAWKARETIRREQGGTARTSEVLLALLATRA
ncbi:MAG: glycosyltransferase N-terminal domain-containing protein [Limnohabitans sp.]|nr:glycosyltransferase N-terminal domain-containing protein [Limnohabitans sp.]